jgi:hypothetical protein
VDRNTILSTARTGIGFPVLQVQVYDEQCCQDRYKIQAVLRIRDGLKYFNSLMRIRDGSNSDPGFGIEKTLLPGQVQSTKYRQQQTVSNYRVP